MFQTKGIILVLLFLGTAVSLQVSIVPAQGEISVGESKFFLCEVVDGAKEIDWFSPTGEKIDPSREDISVLRNDDTSSTLTIYSAVIDSAGTYKCVASGGGQESEATVSVKIFQKLTFKNAPSPQEFNEGDNANIICDVVSSPPPTVIWTHKGVKIQVEKDVRFKTLSNNHLQIRGIKKADEGTYVCEGRVMVRGEIDFTNIRVVVNVLPTVRIRQAEVNATADTGHSALLACDADGFPEPTVTWARNGVVLEAGEKYGFNEDGSELTIREVRKLDEGDYTCIARNKAGKSEQELSLRVFVKPKITYLENQTITELELQITLTCEATGDPTPSITWSFGETVFTEGEQASWTRPEQHKSLDGNVVVRSDARVSSLTLKFAQYTDAGQYLCTARNAIGQSSQHMYLEVHYAPKIQGSVTVYTWEGNPANISCEVLAHPGDVSMVWLRDGIQLPNANTTNIKIFNSPSASYLEVTPESQNDFGSYNCTASNEIGTESKEFILIPADVPSAPTIERVDPYSSTAQVIFEEPDATGGVPVLKYRAAWRALGRGNWVQRIYDVRDGGLSTVTITGLKPETQYEVKMAAINGKGEGESCLPEVFKTQPVREPNPPKLEGTLQPKGNSLKVRWIKQDDGGSPIKHYLVKYKARQDADWKPEIRLPKGSEYVTLTGLDWDTEYDVFVVAENQRGKSLPGTLTFRTASESSAAPAAPDSLGDGTGLNTGIIVGILVVVFVLLLVAVDVTCYFLNKCGLLMCICGKSGPGTKGKDIEEGKAAFIKDESKEPIVEVRTEEECTANHDVGGHTEPDETTPLTEPERAADAAAAPIDLPLSVAANSDTVTESFDISQSSPTSESTILTSSIAAPETSTPKINPPATPPPSSRAAPRVAPLVDLGDGTAAEAAPVVGATATERKSPAPTPTAARASPRPAPTARLPKGEEPQAPEREAASSSLAQSPAQPLAEPTRPESAAPAPALNHQVDGEAALASDTGLYKDVFAALGTAGSNGPSAPAQDEKILGEETSAPEEAGVKKVQPEAPAEPNDSTQASANESKA